MKIKRKFLEHFRLPSVEDLNKIVWIELSANRKYQEPSKALLYANCKAKQIFGSKLFEKGE